MGKNNLRNMLGSKIQSLLTIINKIKFLPKLKEKYSKKINLANVLRFFSIKK